MTNPNDMEVDNIDQQEEVDDDLEEDEESDSSDEEGEEKTYLPGNKLEEGEELEIDENAYVLYHQASLGPPCLSFDIIADQCKADFPLSVTAVAGTQAAKVTANAILVFRMSNLHPVKATEEGDDEEDDGVDDEEVPVMKMAGIKHPGCVNRVKFNCIGPTPVVAAWSETGSVAVWNLSSSLQKLDLPGKEVVREEAPPLQAFTGHGSEGFALDWSGADTGVLASGDCNRNIHVWKPGTGGSWAVSERPYSSHTASVEDVRWSPNEKNVLVSCSCDKTIKVWDVRVDPAKACMLTQGNAHSSDINVIDWNPNDPFIVSGGDDGMVKIWDLRTFGGLTDPLAVFKHHQGAVTGVEWHRSDNTVLASAGEDDQIALWDLALERDSEAAGSEDPSLKDLPPQLLFIHQGLKEVKELHWHPKVPGLLMATSHTGFDVFRTISV